MIQISNVECFRTPDQWKGGRNLIGLMTADEKFRIRYFISKAIDKLRVSPVMRGTSGFIFWLPVVLHLFEGLGRADTFVQ